MIGTSKIGIPIPILYDEGQYLHRRYWIPHIDPHMIVSGATGSGKSIFIMSLMGRISLRCPNARIYLADFKGGDEFNFLRRFPHSRYYLSHRYAECIQDVYSIFQQRRKGDSCRDRIFMVCEEMSSFLSYLTTQDKALAKDIQSKLSQLLYMSRGFRIQLISVLHRADASLLGGAERAQYSCRIALGTLDPDAAKMMFGEAAKQIPATEYYRGQGRGYLMTSRSNRPVKVVVPKIRDFGKLQKAILDVLTR